MRRVLVTGGAGFIGSHLVDALVSEGDHVTVLDDLSIGRASNLAEHDGEPRFKLIRGSVLNKALVDRLVAEHEVIFHLAAVVGVHHVMRDPIRAMRTNVHGTDAVLEAALRHGRRVLIASTSEVYGHGTAVPFAESGDRVLGPTWVHRWSYSTAKALDEHLAFAYASSGLRMSIVRYFNAHGPRLDPSGYGSVIARFATQALRGEALTVHGDGEQTRCFTFVTDTVRGTILAATREEAIGNVFNIGADREISIRQLAEMVDRALGTRSRIDLVPYESDYPAGFQDTRRRVPDTQRARRLLGFVPEVALEEGLARTLSWCRENYSNGSRLA